MLSDRSGMPVDYELYAWQWRPNSSGMFAPFNPDVPC